MVEWKRRFLTGVIAVPSLFLILHYKFALLTVIHIVVFLAQKEYRNLIKNALEINSPESVGFFLNSMSSSVISMLPSHFFLQGVSIFTDDHYIHLFYFFSILTICLIRIVEFINATTRLKSNENKEKSESLNKKLYIITLFQICMDAFGFTIFTFPLSFQLYFTNYPKGIGFMLFWIITAWQSDNGALFFGSLFGSHPFVPVVSPKKTMEGVFGAIILSVGTGFFLSYYKDSGLIYFPNIPTLHYVILSLIIGVVAIFGDFVESFVKRAANVKDSGALFPGHGGMLDRLDSLVITAPILFFYAKIFIDFNTLY